MWLGIQISTRRVPRSSRAPHSKLHLPVPSRARSLERIVTASQGHPSKGQQRARGKRNGRKAHRRKSKETLTSQLLRG